MDKIIKHKTKNTESKSEVCFIKFDFINYANNTLYQSDLLNRSELLMTEAQ